jgi:hypothetical protein
MEMLRDTLLTAAANDITLHAVRVTTKENALADALSRFDWRAVADFAPSWQIPSLLSRR